MKTRIGLYIKVCHKYTFLLRKWILISIPIFVSPVLMAQQDSVNKSKIFKVWITLNNLEIKDIYGILYQVKDSSVTVSSVFELPDQRSMAPPITLNYKNLDVVKLRSKGRVVRGAVIGFVPGFILGGLFGYAAQKHGDTSGEIASLVIQNGIKGGAICASIGGLAASIKIRIPINGSLNKFSENKDRLQRRSYIH
jgi:hypothetical protein